MVHVIGSDVSCSNSIQSNLIIPPMACMRLPLTVGMDDGHYAVQAKFMTVASLVWAFLARQSYRFLVREKLYNIHTGK